MNSTQRDESETGIRLGRPSDDERLEVSRERVTLTMSVPALGDRRGEPIEFDADLPLAGDPKLALDGDDPPFELPWTNLHQLRMRLEKLGGAPAVMAVAWLLFGDPRVAVMAGLVVLLPIAAWAVDRRVASSFGTSPAWPRGVQEDDDVRWVWQPRRVSREGHGP